MLEWIFLRMGGESLFYFTMSLWFKISINLIKKAPAFAEGYHTNND